MRLMVDIITIYNWDETIFDDFVIPEGMNKETLIQLMMRRLANMRVIYSEPNTLKTYINYWSHARLPIWQRLYALAIEQYDPLENLVIHKEQTFTHGHIIENANTEHKETSASNTNTISGTEAYTDTIAEDVTDTGHNSSDNTVRNTGTKTEENTLTKEDHKTENGSSTLQEEINEDLSTNEETHNFVYGYNSETAANKDYQTNAQTQDNTKGRNGTTTQSNNILDEYEDTENKSEEHSDNTTTLFNEDTRQVKDRDESIAHNATTSESNTGNSTGEHDASENKLETHSGNDSESTYQHGNAGVNTTAQKMAEEELKLRPKLDLYNYITEEFKAEFCIMLY